MSDTLCASDAATIRAEIARADWPIYQVAAAVGRHPARLATLLHSEQPFPEELGRRILMVLKTRT